VLLETYLRAILTHKNPVWRTSYTFLDFLAVPQHTANRKGSSGDTDGIHWTPANWLAEHGKVEGSIRAIRSELLKRDALASMGDAAGSRGSSVAAKKLIREAGEKIDMLARGLEVIGSAVGDGERKRRGEMVESLRNERADLGRMAEAGVRTSREVMGGSSGFSRTSGSGTTSGVMPGGSASLWGNGNSAQPATGRVFGKKPEETDETRPLDDRGVLQLQQTKMEGQDDQLKELSKILQRQRGMGEEIHREIGEQTAMLEDIEHGVDKVGGKMARAKRNMNKLG
jgi:regulator of vacuolar morphogenesis